MSLLNIISQKSGLALDLCSGSLDHAEGGKVVQWQFHNDANQRWIFSGADEDGYVVIHPDVQESSSKYALDALQESTGKVSIESYSGNDSQKWKLVQPSPSLFLIKSKILGLVLDVCEGSTENGAEVVLYHENGGENQLWRVVPTSHVQFPLFSEVEMQKHSVNFANIESNLVASIDQYGFCVVENVLTSDEIEQASAAWGQDIVEVIDREAIMLESKVPCAVRCSAEKILNTEPSEVASALPGYFMHANHHSLPQGRFAWMMRLHPNIRRVYEVLHGLKSEDLVVGMDCVFYRPKKSKSSDRTSLWGHCDMNGNIPLVSNWDVYQSVVSIWGSDTKESSTTVVWPSSHKEIYPLLMKEPSVLNRGHFVPLDLLYNNKQQIRQGAWINERYVREARRVPLQPGSLLVWNSRTMHQGWTEGPRFAMPVCWEPKERRSREAFNRKLRLCASGLPTTHWASLGKQHNVKLLAAHAPSDFSFSPGESEDSIRLPFKASIMPRAILPGVLLRSVLEVCAELEETGDSSNTIADQLQEMIDPAIVAVL